MNNLYHKVAVASVCTALGFALGASEEAKAATFTLPPTITFQVNDNNFDGRGDRVQSGNFDFIVRGTFAEAAEFGEINIGSFSLAPNTVISRAIFQAEIDTFLIYGFGVSATNPGSVGIFGYVGNGTAEASDFEAGVLLSSVDISSSSSGDILNFDITPFVKQRVSNGDAFAGFGIRALNLGGLFLNNYDPFNPSSGIKPRLIVETADVTEPVPEPTTMLCAAIALGWGGWLKRKHSSPQHKTRSQD